MDSMILTLRMDKGAQSFFDRMRKTHYPAELNQIAAHLTLFHTLPSTQATHDSVHAAVRRQAPFSLAVTGLRPLGRGVAYTIRSPDLLTLHAALSRSFAGDLSAQDKQRFLPHVVIQNKATPERARVLLAELERDFHQLEAQAEGLDLWHYLGGPWRLAESFAFTSAADSSS